MNDFKEWLSDYLRYFLLLLAALLTLALIVIGVRVYRAVTQPASGDSVEILTETDSERSFTEELKEESDSEEEEETPSVMPTVTSAQAETLAETELVSANETESDAIEAIETETETEAETETESETETETETESEYVPVYKTLKGSCYIRSAPSMEADIIGEYMYGTTVEFLEDVGGWYKVQIDGMVGYMGARFF